MAREELLDANLEAVTGGSICVSPDYKTCGYNCNNQYNIVNLSKMIEYYNAHYLTMNEPTMLANMVIEGYITPIA